MSAEILIDGGDMQNIGAPGFIAPDNFMVYAKYVSTKWYEKGSPQDYLKATQQQGSAQPTN